MMIAVETHHFVTQVIVILVKNVTSVTTELMAPADRVEMGSPPRKMAPAVNLMKVDNVTMLFFTAIPLRAKLYHLQR